MRRGSVSLLVVIVLCALAFWGGRRWERDNCRIDWPNRLSDIDNSIVCKGFRSNLPPVPNPTVRP
jgi:hypothetical protein